MMRPAMVLAASLLALLPLAAGPAAAGSLGFSFDRMPGSVFAPGQIGRTDPISSFDGPRVPTRIDNSDLIGTRGAETAERLDRQMWTRVDPATGLLCRPAAGDPDCPAN